MATVVITLSIALRFDVYKMDADIEESRRDHIISRREKRWSMNSQRLEEIVGELMKPISDVRRSFDTDLSALLEEYLTEAGLHALESAEDEVSDPAAAVPNFAELALLLQQSASIYGRKVDFLYQHVLSVSDSLHNSTLELANSNTTTDEPQTPTTSRRKRKASVHGDFTTIELEASSSATREVEAARPPPTLARMYVELEPRVMSDNDVPLLDYSGEPIGLLSDFHVTWRLQDGQLVDELECSSSTSSSALRPIPLMELQAAIEAAAPPPLPPGSPCGCSTPLPAPSPAPLAPPPAPETSTEPHKRERKRRNDDKVEDVGRVKLLISKELRRKLRSQVEFSINSEWVTRVVAERKAQILSLRRELRGQFTDEFRGFDSSDVGGFLGWSPAEALVAATTQLEALQGTPGAPQGDSDDDGFFEQSSLGDSDADLNTHTCESVSAWQSSVLARAAAGEQRGADVRELARTVLCTLETSPRPPRSDAVCYSAVLSAAAADTLDVSRLFLATLFLANAGNVEIIQGAPLSVDSFSLRLVSSDAARYCAAADVDPAFKQR